MVHGGARGATGPRVQGDFGPLYPGIPAYVPLWLALRLKENQLCSVIPPEWLSVGTAPRHVRLASCKAGTTAAPAMACTRCIGLTHWRCPAVLCWHGAAGSLKATLQLEKDEAQVFQPIAYYFSQMAVLLLRG
jgi:hypothetical protein